MLGLIGVKRIAFAIYVAVIGVLITATVLEKTYGTPFVMEHIYGAWWFIALWGLLCVGSIVTLIRAKLYKRPVTMLLHLSFVIILVGALVTHLFGLQGSVHLRLGETTDMIENRETGLIEHLPFTVTLKDFQLKTYPGTQSPMDYVSVFTTSSGEELSVSMNKIGECQSYRFYQSGYDPDLQGTYLSVSHDPWGIGITYTGYALLILSMILKPLPNPFQRRGNWLQRFKVQGSRFKVLLFILLVPFLPLQGEPEGVPSPKTLPTDVAAEFGDLYTYYNGRICPFQTMAIDFTTKLYGKSTYQGLSAEQVVTGWMLFPSTWVDQPFIKIKGQTVHELLKTDETYVSYNRFFDKGQYRLDDVLYQLHTGASLPDARAVTEVDEKMNLLLMLWNGQLLKLYPVQTLHSSPSISPHLGGARGGLLHYQWYSQADNLPDSLPHDQWFFIKHSMDYVGELAVQHDYQELTATLQKIRQYQQKTMGDANLPSDFRFKAEKLYNSLNYIKFLAILLLTIGIIAYIVKIVNDKWFNGKWFLIFLMTISVASFIYLLLFITLRTIVSGHVPLTNGFEVMVFMSACSLLFAIARGTQRSYGLIVAGLTLLVAMMGQSNPQITLLMPVLSSPLLSIHVCLVMLSYTLFAFLALNSLAALIAGKNVHSPLSTLHSSLFTLRTAVFLLAAGIILGAVWANQSWGRYWGWDPKEVWALITLMVYAIPLHSSLFTPLHSGALRNRSNACDDGRFISPKEARSASRGWVFFHLYMIFAFLTVIITYFGVNFFLGGMHSYANG